MPNYTVHYFMIKPTHVPVQAAATGSSSEVSPVSDAANEVRARILAHFEELLADFMVQAAAHIPHDSQEWTASVLRIPESSPGVPNFAPVTIRPQDPIVYIVTRRNELSTGSSVIATNRRASLAMFSDINGHYAPGIPSSLMSQARSDVTNDPQTIAGKAVHFSDYVPAVAEIFGDLRMQYEASNWEDIQARALAKVAFHEIAHCKAECANRGSGQNWRNAISGSIHNVSGVSLCGSSLDGNTSPAAADFQLMGQHMLCPIWFYRLDQPIEGQFFTNGAAADPNAGATESDDSDSDTDTHSGADLSGLDDLDDI